jgi:hypothetical protein
VTRHSPPDHVAAADQARFRGSPLQELGGSACRGDALLASSGADAAEERKAGATVCDRELSGYWDRAEAGRLLDMLGLGGAP